LIIWIDAQLPPAIAPWIKLTFDIQTHAVRDLGLRDAKDLEIFNAARDEEVVVMTKDRDFLRLLEQHGPPPQILWVTCGDTSNDRLKEVLAKSFPVALQLLRKGEPLIELSDAQ